MMRAAPMLGNRVWGVLSASLLPLLMAGCLAARACPEPSSGMQPMQDVQYLQELKDKAKAGVITEVEKEQLWEAYLFRLRAFQPYGRPAVPNFVPPQF